MGAGLAGLATAYLARKRGHEVRVFAHGPSASRIGSGLMHPYGGVKARLNRFGREGMEASLALIPQEAIVRKGLLRLAVDETLAAHFQESGLPWISAEEVVARNPAAAPVPGIWIEEGYVIDMERYLQFLRGDLEIEERIEEWGDVTVWAIGAHAQGVSKVKGQSLLLKLRDHQIGDVINSYCYLIPKGEDHLLVGATFEREAANWEVDAERAKEQLYPKLKKVMPHFDPAKVESVQCCAGLRATTKGHLPIIQQLDGKNWLFTGLGSKGLLYHALYANQLTRLCTMSTF